MNPQSLQDPHADTAAKPDAALITLIGEFHEAYELSTAAGEKWLVEKHRVEALTDCPPFAIPVRDREAYERHNAFLVKHGVMALSDRSTECWQATGKLAGKVFATPAHTLEGAVEKLKIVRLARGDNPTSGDHDLDAYEPNSDERWFANVMRDFERLTQPTGPDPFVDLAKRYIATVDEFEGERGRERTDEENEAYDVNVRMPLERELANMRPASREGVVAALGLVLREHREAHGGGELCWTEEYVVALLENARCAVAAGPGGAS